MERSVDLDRLPEGLSFPLELSDRIVYDEARRKLKFSGFMSKADFDRLAQLHESWSYRRAIEGLFRVCTLDLEVDPAPSPINRLARVFGRLIPHRD